MSEKPVDVQIFGRTIRINCPTNKQDALNKAVEDLNQRLQELKSKAKSINIEHLIFIAALNVCNELAEEKMKTREFSLSMEKKIKILQNTIRKALTEQENLTDLQNKEEKIK